MHTPSLASLVEDAKRQMTSITGMEYDTVSQFDQANDGWTMVIDMLEHRSIPRTQDLLSSYEVALDTSGRLKSWRRTSRYTRGQQQG